MSVVDLGRFFVCPFRRSFDMLSEIQFYVIAVVASALVYGIKLLAAAKVQLHRGWLTAIVYLVSGGLAYAWSAVAFPLFPAWGGELGAFVPALFVWFTDLLVAVGPMVAFATLIYNALLAKVLDDAVARFLPAPKKKKG
jgi:hypothetical protein